MFAFESASTGVHLYRKHHNFRFDLELHGSDASILRVGTGLRCCCAPKYILISKSCYACVGYFSRLSWRCCSIRKCILNVMVGKTIAIKLTICLQFQCARCRALHSGNRISTWSFSKHSAPVSKLEDSLSACIRCMQSFRDSHLQRHSTVSMQLNLKHLPNWAFWSMI